jgi:hypothetical protein
MRNPAIHIRRSDLLKAMKEIGFDVTMGDVNDIFKASLKYSIRNRVLITTKNRKKVERYVEASTNLVTDFNRIYQGVVVANNIKAMAIHKGSQQYLTLTEVTNQAVEFCQLFDLGYETGFKLFVELGLKILRNKFSIYRLKGCASRIVEHWKSKLVIDGDDKPKQTDIMVVAWHTAVKTYYSKNIGLDDPELRSHFIYARIDADSMDADYYDWMYAQFEKWHYLNQIPHFTQLYGDNAKIVYQMYMAKINPTKEDSTYFNKVKNVKKEDIPTKASQQKESIRKARLQASLRDSGQSDNGGEGTD